jgi:hypothetical protein
MTRDVMESARPHVLSDFAVASSTFSSAWRRKRKKEIEDEDWRGWYK